MNWNWTRYRASTTFYTEPDKELRIQAPKSGALRLSSADANATEWIRADEPCDLREWA